MIGSTPQTPKSSRFSPRRTITIAVLIVIFAVGALHWLFFLNYGRMSFRLHDWGQEYIYYSVLRQAISSGRMPYHMSMRFHETDRFLSIPDTNLAPQVLLLPVTSTGRFILIDFLILYSLGFIGCLLIRRKYGLSLLPFTAFFLLLNFNGHITCHLAVGHSAWSGYFLLPFFFFFILEMLEGGSARTYLKLGLIMFAMMLKGSFHLYTWCAMFLVFLAVFNWKYARQVFFSLVLGAGLSAFRLVPAAFGLLGRKEKFIWAYPTLRDLVDAMITIRQKAPERLLTWGNPGWWEYDMYIGLVGLLIILYFGVYLRFSKRPELGQCKYSPLDLPIFLTSLFSLSYIHAFVTRVPLPLLRGERVATRFIVLPLMLLALLACLRLDRLLGGLGHRVKVVTVGVGTLVLLALGFVDHSFLWSVSRLERITTLKDPPPVVSILSRTDPTYKTAVIGSWLISLTLLAVVAYITLRPVLTRAGRSGSGQGS
jgi:hypothetical protein